MKSQESWAFSNRRFATWLLVTLLAVSVFSSFLLRRSGQAAAAQLSDENWRSKIAPLVWESAQSGQAEFLVILSEQANLSEANSFLSKAEKGWYVYRQLTAIAQRTQAPLVENLRQRGVQVRPYWVANMIWVRGDINEVIALSMRRDVARLAANPAIRLDLPLPQEGTATQSVSGVEWNLTQVNADDVWALGYRGQGVVIGGQDTGYDWQHPALKSAYRGWDGNQANHDYNWHDAIHEPIQNHLSPERDKAPLSALRESAEAGEKAGTHLAGEEAAEAGNERLSLTLSCPYNSAQPCDDNGHGTHTMGTMVGSTPNDQIGMAPQARWIGCRNMEGGVGTPATYAECYQWFIAPTKIDGSDPNPALAPDVINNSWACPPEEGCEDPNILKSVVEAVRAAGILSVHSAGNDGPDCETVRNPATIYPASLSVGAVDDSGLIASFSSRGPVTVDGSQRLKPNVVAPGVKIRSSLPGSTYGESSGTSMAAPHVAGLAALILSARPSLKGQADVIENLILASAKPLTSGQTCGGVPGTQIPNNTYGWGRIDAWEAIRLAFPYTYYFPLVGSSR